MSEYLSGVVSGLEERVQQLETDVVQFPTTSEFNTLSAQGTSQYNVTSTSLTDMQAKLASLETYVVNLRSYVLAFQRTFTGHTGATGHG